MIAGALLLAVTISTLPPTPLVEITKNAQALNFDFLLVSPSKTKIRRIEASVVAANGALITQRRIAADVLPQSEFSGKMVVFNPFHEFDPAIPLDTIRYDFTFEDDSTASIVVKPRRYEPRADLILPLRGRVFVHDGHDFYSHHRRLDITGGMTTALGVTENMMRYAYDFVIVDEMGRMHRGDGMKNEDWPGFGQPILAPADGVVVAAAGDRPDGSKAQRAPLDRDAVLKDITLIMGNYVIIDHGHGERSMLGHMKQGSVTVKAGDRVKRGQQIGAMGCSGDAMFPHLHYQLQRDALLGEGLPSYFRDYRRFTGASWVRVPRGAVDTGDIVESTR